MPGTGTVWRRTVAVLGSFGVYGIPLVGPHAAWFLGETLVGTVGADRSLAWKAADISVALAAQIAVSFEPGDIQDLRVGDGWVAWDAYRETGPYQIGRSLSGGSGRHWTNEGRSVTSAAVDPTGSFVAVSETTTLSIGNAKDVVYVLRTSDGPVVFRRYLPRYSRSHLVFFDGGLFGYSDPAGTHILTIPERR